MKKSCLLFLFFSFALYTYAEIPGWYEHQAVYYPTDQYITAIGEGKTKSDAETKAVSVISLYFQTTTDICNQLIQKYNESDSSSGDYKFTQSKQIQEKSKISSSVDFFGIQFAEGFVVDGLYTTLAYIDRNTAFKSYNQRIRNNSDIIESLLEIAEDDNNPLYGYEAARKAIPYAEMNTQLLKQVKLVKPTDDNYYAKDNELISRIYKAFETAKNNRIFYIDVQNDYKGMVKRTISDLLEKEGYNISENNGTCQIPVEIEISEEENASTVFLYCGLVVNITTAADDVIFSYSRNFGKKGGKTKDQAYKRAFQEIQNELNATFMTEFNKKIKAE